jgi:hypothetical protein
VSSDLSGGAGGAGASAPDASQPSTSTATDAAPSSSAGSPRPGANPSASSLQPSAVAFEPGQESGGGEKRGRDSPGSRTAGDPVPVSRTWASQTEPPPAPLDNDNTFSVEVTRLLHLCTGLATAHETVLSEVTALSKAVADLKDMFVGGLGGNAPPRTEQQEPRPINPARASKKASKTRNEQAKLIVSKALEEAEQELKTAANLRLASEEMATMTISPDISVPIPAGAGQLLKKNCVSLSVPPKLDSSLVADEQRAVEIAYRATMVTLHASLISSKAKQADSYDKLLADRLKATAAKLDDLFVTVPPLPADTVTAERASARALLDSEWVRVRNDTLTQLSAERQKKLAKKEQLAEAELNSLQNDSQNSVRTFVDKRQEQQEQRMVNTYGLTAVASEDSAPMQPTALAAKVKALRENAAEQQRLAAGMEKAGGKAGKKPPRNTGGKASKGKKAPRAASASPARPRASSGSKNGERSTTPHRGAQKQGGRGGGRSSSGSKGRGGMRGGQRKR